MNKCSPVINGAASPARTNGCYAKCGQLSERVSHVSRGCKNRRGPGRISQEPSVSTSNVTPPSHQRRWSTDFCKCGTSPIITVKKNKKEPPPPQRGVSLLRPHATSHYSSKRYSCPPIGVFNSPTHSSSSSSSSSTSSCSSPPPVQTSAITGPDPLGWKLRPKSKSASPWARTNRLSLQISLPVIHPEPESSPADNSQSVTANPDPSPKTKPPLKPHRRRHSDSSAFLRSLAPPLPVVTLEELNAVHLHQLTLLDESDDVFSGGDEEEVKGTTRPRKIAPPVPEKTSMARHIAQLMAQSHQQHGPDGEIIYTLVIKPKPKLSHQTELHNRLNARITAGLRVDTSCDRERSTPRFPGRETP